MADLEAIRRGLAALLRDALPETEGQVSPWLIANPTKLSLQVAGIDEMTRTDFADGTRWVFLIEASLSDASNQGSQRTLDDLITAVPEALEDDETSAGALTKRLQDDGTVDTGEDPAADSVAFLEYRGAQRVTREGGGTMLSATWAVEVLA